MKNLCLFMIGGSLASFIDVVSYRMVKKENFIKGRSYCESCHHQLFWFDLLPVFSYFLLLGRCRYCHQRIAVSHPLVEVIGGGIMIKTVFCFGWSFKMIVTAGVCFVLLLIALNDWKTMEIDVILIVAVLAGALLLRKNDLNWHVFVGDMGSVSVFMILMNIFIASSFGMGDIELMAVSGILLGWQLNILAMMIAIMTAGIYGGYLLIIKKVSRDRRIPFAPFLVLGILMMLFYGEKVLLCYLLPR